MVAEKMVSSAALPKTRKRKATTTMLPSLTDVPVGDVDNDYGSGSSSSSSTAPVSVDGPYSGAPDEGKGKGRAVDSGGEDEDEEEEDDGGGGDDADMQWEDVLEAISASNPVAGESSGRDLELTLAGVKGGVGGGKGEKKKGASAEERRVRLVTHCLHVQFLLFHGSVRNRWLCDPELQSILLSHLTPGLLADVERLQVKLGKSSARSGNGGAKKGLTDPTLKVLGTLIHWWRKKFTVDQAGLRRNGYKSMSQFVIEKEEKEGEGKREKFRFTTGRVDSKTGERVYTLFKNEGERVQDLEEFRTLARECRGSRDTGAMFFTALLRAIGLDARMVFSLQPLGFGFTARDTFSKKVETTSHELLAPNEKSAGKKPARKRQRVEAESPSSSSLSELDSSYDDSEESGGFVREDIKKKAKTKKTPQKPPSSKSIDRDLPYPVIWTEVYSPVTSSWITVDSLVLTALGSTPDLLSKFEPKGKKAESSKQVIAYVMAYSGDGTVKDVTVRYLAKNAFPGKTKGFRVPPADIPVYDLEGRAVATHKRDWFGNIMRGYRASEESRMDRDVEEDVELNAALTVEATRSFAGNGKESIGWYKGHPEYVLERHMKRDEGVRPGKSHVKTFRTGKGDKAKDEKVYARKDVVDCKTVENWYRDGRVVKEGEQPIKNVKPRAATLNRRREIEEAQRDGDTVLQGLYSREQTEEYVPPKIVDGEIPRNKFGNIDIYTRSMIPAGTIHLPLRGSGRVARKLGISYADAVTGFEFSKQRATPYINGIVIAAENEGLLRDAWSAEEEQKRIKEDDKREKAALTLWRRFIVGLRIVQRLHEVYGDGDGTEEANPFTARKSHGKGKEAAARETQGEDEEAGGSTGDEPGEPGGFMRDGDEGDDTEMGGGGFLLDLDEDTDEQRSTRKNSVPAQVMSMKDMLAQQGKDKRVKSGPDSEMEEEEDEEVEDASYSCFIGKTAPTTTAARTPGRNKRETKKPVEPKRKTPRRKATPKAGTRSKHFINEPEDAEGEVPTPRRSLRKRG